VKLDNGLAEGDCECCHGISPLVSGVALLPHAALIKLVDLLLFTNTRLRLIVGFQLYYLGALLSTMEPKYTLIGRICQSPSRLI
jgi:hypothetical protein